LEEQEEDEVDYNCRIEETMKNTLFNKYAGKLHIDSNNKLENEKSE